MAGNGYPVVAKMGHINGWKWIPSSGRDGACKWLGVDTQ